MPLFEYKCEKCGMTVEKIISFSDVDTPQICEVCGNILTKLFTPNGSFELKYDPKKDKVSWGNENYSSTQRYREYDKQATGKYFVQGK